MSTNDRTESADIWNDVGDSQDERQKDPDSGAAGNGRPAPDERFADESDVLEAEATEVKRKPKVKMGLIVIALIGVSALGFAAHLGYSLYSKLFQTEVTQTQDNAGLVDLVASLPVAPTTDEAAGSRQTLPVGGGTSPTDVPTTPVDQLVPQDVAAAVASSAPVDIKPAAASSVTPPVACPVAAPAPACPSTPSTFDKPRTTAVPNRTTPWREASVSRRKTKSTSAVKATKPVQAPASPVEVESGPGTLTGFKVLAIEPKTGEFQQAWIRGSDGRLYIVREGDSIQGGQVTSVRFADGSVKTTIGDVRK